MSITTAQTSTQEARIHRNCPLCGAPPPDTAPLSYSDPEWPLKQCPDCSMVYLEWAPAYARLEDELGFTTQHDKYWEKRLKEQPVLATLDKLTMWRLGMLGDPTPASGLRAWAKPGPVLDVGCGDGDEFEKLPPGYTPYGIEIERSAAATARAIFEPRGGHVINADGVSGLAQLPEKFFNGVAMWGYLEHEANPKDALQGVRRVVKDDAVVVVKVPNYGCWNRTVLGRKWTGFWHPDHTQYFTPKTMARMAQACGFSAYFRLYGRIPLNDYMYVILRPV
ncbi:MAG TPA: methyltransferase domain-containing protein [Rhizomicrobium sp.]